jgi:hypothetical protein
MKNQFDFGAKEIRITGRTACCCSGALQPLAQAVYPYQPLNGIILDLVGEIAAIQ